MRRHIANAAHRLDYDLANRTDLSGARAKL
jgi:hypothetical protein